MTKKKFVIRNSDVRHSIDKLVIRNSDARHSIVIKEQSNDEQETIE